MKLYFYIHTGHRYGLDRLRRGAVLYKKLLQHGIESEVLLNDYRATMVAKELGIESSTAIDSMYNIATIAEAGDGLIVDTPELTDELLQQMCKYFRVVVNFSEEKQKFSEKVISQTFEDQNSVRALFVDDFYFKEFEKTKQTLLFYGDEDYEKNLLKKASNFKDMDLLLGHYFFLQYEDELKPYFNTIVQEYEEIVNYKNIITNSFQSALEAGASGAKVCYIGEKMFSFVTLQKELGLSCQDSDKTPVDGGCADFIDRENLKKLSQNLNYNIIFDKLDLSQFKFN